MSDWIPLNKATMQLIEARGMHRSTMDRAIHSMLKGAAEKGTANGLWVRQSWLKGLQPTSQDGRWVSLREVVEGSWQQVPLRLHGWEALQNLKYLMAAAGPELPLYARIVERCALPGAVGHAFCWEARAMSGHMGPLCESPQQGAWGGYVPTKYATCEACKAQLVEDALTG